MIYLDNVMEAIGAVKREQAELKREIAQLKELLEEIRRGLFGDQRR